MPEDNVISITIQATDTGVVKVVQDLVASLNKLEEPTKKAQQSFDKVTESAKKVREEGKGLDEMFGLHLPRGISLLSRGITSELDPSLAALIGRFQGAALGARLLGEGLSTPMVIGIGAAVTAIVGLIRSLKESITWNVALQQQIDSMNLGGLSGLVSLARTAPQAGAGADAAGA